MQQRKESAELWGIEPGYFDVQGRWQEADPEIVRRVIEALSAGGTQPAGPEATRLQPAFRGEGRRMWLLAVQLYAVRSRCNWGHGDFSDLVRLLEIVADAGGAGIGLNPLHALFYDRGGTGSPYSPNSRLFLNPLYIDVEAIEEFRSIVPARELERLRAGELVDYAAVAELKLAALREAHQNFATHGSDARKKDFESYRQERGDALARFAAFEMLRGKYPGAWWGWPVGWRQPDKETLRKLRESDADEFGFHEFLQWNAERQLAHCRDVAKRRGLTVGLYIDTAVGVDPAGADAWMDQKAMLCGLSVGAPPDLYNPAGQNWGLTSYNPHDLVATKFEPLRQMLAEAMRYAGAIRIDHVLGLQRLFVVPHGAGPKQGVYLRMPVAQMLATVAEESRRWRCVVIGEDLGTVPEGFRGTLSAWGVWSYLVMLFERSHGGAFRGSDGYAENAIATFGTHDLPTFAGWMSGDDLVAKRKIGLEPGESDDERQRSRVALRAAVASGDAGIHFEDVVKFLAAAPTRLVSIAIEDVLEMTEQVNIPGTVEEHPNWRRQWPVALEDLGGDERLQHIAETLKRAGRGNS
jgi:4-alpha-glucanotransferase